MFARRGRRALENGWVPDEISLTGKNLSKKKGDAVTASVARRVVVAKVTRDRMMDRYHRRYPAYGFDHNRGYGTKQHRDAIGTPGPSPIHRYSFKGLRTGFYDGDRVESS